MRILLVKPSARLATIRGLQAFQRLEPLELGYLAAAAAARPRHPGARPAAAWIPGDRLPARGAPLPSRSRRLHRLHARGLGDPAPRAPGRASTARPPHRRRRTPRDGGAGRLRRSGRRRGGARRGLCAVPRAWSAASARARSSTDIPNVRVPAAARGGEELPRYPDPATLPTPRRDLWPAQATTGRCGWSRGGRPWQPLFPPVATVRTSYGCRMKCTFCVVPFLSEGRHLGRPVDAVADEIAALSAEHVYFVDDENFLDEEHALALADALASARRAQALLRLDAGDHRAALARDPAALARDRSRRGLPGLRVHLRRRAARRPQRGHGRRQRAGPRRDCARSASPSTRRSCSDAGDDRRGLRPAARLRPRPAADAVQLHRLHPIAGHAGLRRRSPAGSGSTSRTTSTTACTR